LVRFTSLLAGRNDLFTLLLPSDRLAQDAFNPGLHGPDDIRRNLASPAKVAGGMIQALWKALRAGKVTPHQRWLAPPLKVWRET